MARLTIKQASEKLDLPPQAIRCWIQSGKCVFGEVVHEAKSKNGRKTYYISSERLDAYLQGKI